ncbi:glycosyltransferase [Acidianus sp. DSM 29099]|nr:glycosyltransferase [Acidianus sp. RZ1]
MDKVSIFVVYYNSTKISDLVTESLKSLKDLDYPNYEVILVDNGSTDSTLKLLKEKSPSFFKVVRSEKNLYFGGGNNLAMKYSSKEAKWFYTVNPDAIPYSTSLKDLMERMEGERNVIASQGMILTDKKKIDTGRFVSDAGSVIRLHNWLDPKKEYFVTYATGAMMLLRSDVYRRRGFIFHEVPLLYFDSNILGIEAYNMGFKVRYYPIETGYHKGRGNTPIDISEFFITASTILFILETNSKFSKFLRLQEFSNIVKENIRSYVQKKKMASAQRILKAYELAFRLHKSLKLGLSIYKAPHIEFPFSFFFMDMFSSSIRKKILGDLNKSRLVIPSWINE